MVYYIIRPGLPLGSATCACGVTEIVQPGTVQSCDCPGYRVWRWRQRAAGTRLRTESVTTIHKHCSLWLQKQNVSLRYNHHPSPFSVLQYIVVRHWTLILSFRMNKTRCIIPGKSGSPHCGRCTTSGHRELANTLVLTIPDRGGVARVILFTVNKSIPPAS